MNASTAPSPGEPGWIVSPEVAHCAAEWLLALQDEPVADGVRVRWQAWRAADPEHERAWQRIEAVNGRLHGLAAPASAAIARATLAPKGSPRRRQAIAGLAVLLFVGGGSAWTVARHRDGWSGLLAHWAPADERTGPGERRRVTLADGTAVHLNSGSAIQLAYGGTERRLRLLAGEVLVRTAADPAGRPFLVETAQGEARALGTRYTVRQQAGGITHVAVHEGAVRLAPRAAVEPPRVLRAGEQAAFTAHAIQPLGPANPDGAAWADGFIVAKGMPLGELLAELARHSPRPLSCDPAVAGLRVSGSYPLDDIDKVLEALAATLSLDIETATRFWGLQAVQVRLVPRRG